MSPIQKKMAAIALGLMGLLGTMLAMRDRPGAANVQPETALETQAAGSLDENPIFTRHHTKSSVMIDIEKLLC